MKRYTRFVINASLITVILILVSCSGGSNGKANGRSGQMPVVEAVRARMGSLPLTERLSGVVRANNQVEIYPEINAVIEAVHVENGDEVVHDQPLVTLRDTEFKDRLRQANAALKIAEAQERQAEAKLTEVSAQYNRIKTMLAENHATQLEMEQIESQKTTAEADVELTKARVEQARAVVAEHEENLRRTVVRAPVDGTVGGRNAEVGMAVTGNTRLFTLGQLDTVRVEVVLTDHMLQYIDTGQRVEVRAGNLPLGVAEAKLSRISPFLHPVAHSTKAEIDLANPNHVLKSGMFVTADVFYGESEKATLIPLSALYEDPGSGATGVYISRDTLNRIKTEPPEAGKEAPLSDPVPFEFVPVSVIARGRMSAGVTKVQPGSWVVTIGQDLFGEGKTEAKVRPVDWDWVEYLQNLQREDLLLEIFKEQNSKAEDSGSEH